MRITCRINARAVELDVAPHRLLVDVLRDDLGLTGVKRSCESQVCGACTVLLDGQPVSACCTLALEMQGREVLTIEGVAAGGTLHPLQQAFIDRAALQCGFCTPGMIMAALALLHRNPTPTRADIVHGLQGHICRCTGYANIVAAVEQAAGAPDGPSEGRAAP